MRIGIDARLWNETGVGRYIRNLIYQLIEIDKKNDYVLFVNKTDNQDHKSQISNLKNWKIVETDIHWHTIEEQLLFYKVLENECLDLMHFPYFSIPILYSRPFVITIHDLIINHFPTGKASTLPLPVYYLKRLGYQFIIKKAAQKAQKVIAVTQATQDEIIEHLHIPKDKIVVTYEGVDEKVHKLKKIFKDSGHTRLGTGARMTKFGLPNTKYFLYVGNAYPHKNIERLIDAFALVTSEFPDVKLLLVGKKNYFYDRLSEKVTKMQLEKTVIFAGGVSDEELNALYTHAQALVLPSLMEGFGLPGLEAMQSHCLVLASDIPVFKEIYEDAAVYFDPLAVESIRATIREVLKNRQKFQSFIKKGEKQVTHFSWKKMAKETLKVYESCFSIRSS